jgi:hypothetical protein
MSMKRLSRDEAFLIAVNIAKLPSVPRQILKDIPRPAKFGQPGQLNPEMARPAPAVPRTGRLPLTQSPRRLGKG